MTVARLSATHATYMGTATERSSYTSGLTTGDRFIETDTGFSWIWSGAAWVKLLYPTS